MNLPMYILFKSLTLKMKVKDVDDVEDNWQTKVPCQHACAKNGTSRSSHLFTVHNGTFREERKV